ncbi:unnamed protein product [Cyprideis torosa]|uniref:Uncharacterized protein n=1 Tax=Cyprideis torosa TaxID=163714 RepID=A0A7R8WHT4_9CRUS|nr:unnamed protein product [Cyprideis torosa]CAG0894405.1 unnamed protein product [Cyprideis torosa]
MYREFFFVTLCSSVIAASQQVNQDEFPSVPPQYNFHYGITDEEKQVYISHSEDRNDDHTNGEYSWVAPDGARITVRYSANSDTGYVAEVHREEGAIRIRPQQQPQKTQTQPAVHQGPLTASDQTLPQPVQPLPTAPKPQTPSQKPPPAFAPLLLRPAQDGTLRDANGKVYHARIVTNDYTIEF